MTDLSDYEGPDFEELLKRQPEGHSLWAKAELQYGHLGCLAEHIRRSEFKISSEVARQLLTLLDGTDPNYKLTVARRSDAAPASKSKIVTFTRDAALTMAVEELSGFKRGRMKSAFEDVGRAYGLSPEYVRKRVRLFRSKTRKL